MGVSAVARFPACPVVYWQKSHMHKTVITSFLCHWSPGEMVFKLFIKLKILFLNEMCPVAFCTNRWKRRMWLDLCWTLRHTHLETLYLLLSKNRGSRRKEVQRRYCQRIPHLFHGWEKLGCQMEKAFISHQGFVIGQSNSECRPGL